MSGKTIKVITFDLDDTLWDTKPVLIKAEQEVYAWLEKNAPRLTAAFPLDDFIAWRIEFYKSHSELHHQISRLRILAMQEALKQVGYSLSDATEKSQIAFNLFLDHRHKVTFFDSVEPLLIKLNQDYTLGVLTNGNADIFKLPLGKYFDFSLSAEHLNSSKPAIDHFYAAQEICSTTSQEMLHIGDHLDHDIKGATDAGWNTLWFNPKRQPNLHTSRPTQEVSCLSEIPQAISLIELSI